MPNFLNLKHERVVSAIILTSACAIVPAGAWAKDAAAQAETGATTASEGDTGLAEIVVTAQHRQELLRDVPVAVSAVSADTLNTSGIRSTTDLSQIVPSVQFTRSGVAGLVFIRGVGTTNAASGEEGANAVYVDGVYLSDLTQAVNYFNNIERMEVLKGPQGTLFGRNATGGLINIITREPGDRLQAKVQLDYGNYETVNARAYVAGPITDNVSMNLALTKHYQGEGWGRNLTLNRQAKLQDYWGARSKLVARLGGVKVTLAGDYFRDDENTAYWKLDPGTVGTGGQLGTLTASGVPIGWWDETSNQYPQSKVKVWGVSGTVEADLGFATLTSISAYRKTRNSTIFDYDASPSPLLVINFDYTGRSIQQEVRLASAATDPLSWQVGAFYLNTDLRIAGRFSGAAFAPLVAQRSAGVLKTNSYAAFAEATYAITPSTKLTGGIRYTRDMRDFDGKSYNVLASGAELPPTVQPITNLNANKVSWRVALRQDLSHDINVYASVNRGFKAGGYSMQSPTNPPYKPQTITAYEVGLKSELFDRKLRFNVSAYHYDIDDYQVRATASALPGSFLLNAATVKVDGLDVEFEAAPVKALRLFGGFTLLNSRFARFGGPGAAFQAPIAYPRPANCPAALTGTQNPGVLLSGPRTGGFLTCFGDASGNKTPNAPRFTGTFGATYIANLGGESELRFTGLYYHTSSFFFEQDNVASQKAYDLVNGSVEFRPYPNLGLEFFGKNITNKKYAVQKQTTGTSVLLSVGAPRTYGVSLNFDF